ncbi:MAG: glycoside hydrolase family 5 protein [Clostridiales bacterium]|nr:glycoside hydrolase family 5 protein [Clostridiales bacterium]
MGKRFKIKALIMLLLTIVCLFTACADTKQDDNKDNTYLYEHDNPDNLKVWDEISSKQITELMGPGWNIGNQFESTSNGCSYETAWSGTAVTPELIKAVRNAGFNTVRIPVSYIGRVGAAPDYIIEKEWLDRIEEVVGYCYKNGMFVIINIHGDSYSETQGSWLLPELEEQQPVLEKYEAVWKQIAERFKDYDEHLIFESMNEVGGRAECSKEIYDNINKYNQLFLNTVRRTGGNNAGRYVLIPGYNADIENTVSNNMFVIPDDIYLSKDVANDEKRIMISVHYYTPWSFCGDGEYSATQFGADADSSKTGSWGGEAYLEEQFKKLYESFVTKGYPVVIGEYGAADKNHEDNENDRFRAYYCRTLCEMSVKYGAAPIYWDNGFDGKYGFGLFDRRDGRLIKQNITDEIMSAFDKRNYKESDSLNIENKEIVLYEGGGPAKINVTLYKINLCFSSSDCTVAVVGTDGYVYPQSCGECFITVRDETGTGTVHVKVERSPYAHLKLYLVETMNWQEYEGESLTLEKDGMYTATIKLSEHALSSIDSFYLQDVLLHDKKSDKTLCKGGKIIIKEIAVNDKKLNLTKNAEGGLTVNGEELKYMIINRHLGEKVNIISDVTHDNEAGYKLKDIDIKDTNEIKVTFSLTDLSYGKQLN